MKVFCFDVETTGLPKTKGFDRYYPPYEFDKYDLSRIVSIAVVCDDGFEKYSIIRPDTFTILNSEFHGISQEDAIKNGITLEEFFDNDIVSRLIESTVVTGHNIMFDVHILRSELLRINFFGLEDILSKKDYYCTMKYGRDYLKQYKYPKLGELYQKLFNKNAIKLHNALNDAKYTLECFTKIYIEQNNIYRT